MQGRRSRARSATRTGRCWRPWCGRRDWKHLVVLHAGDQVQAILAALEQLTDRDIVVLTGGVSTGQYDLVPESLVQFGAELVFHKVSQKPGKPLLFARRGPAVAVRPARQSTGGPPVFSPVRERRRALPGGLAPGGPAASAANWPPPCGRAECAPRSSWARRNATANLATGWRLQPLPGLSSADIFGPCQANCYLQIPPGNEPLAAGETLSFEWLARWSAPYS